MLTGIHRYFSAIGLPALDPRSVVERVSELAQKGDRLQLRDGGAHVTWRDPSGAAISIYVAPDGAVGALPYLSSARPINALVRETLATPKAPHYDRLAITILGKDDETSFDATVLAHDIVTARDRVRAGAPMQIALTALADTWSCKVDDDARTDRALLAPLGDANGPMVSRFSLRARVLKLDEPVNRHTGVAFQHAKLDLGAIELDALVPEPQQDKPDEHVEPGKVLEGSFLLVATVDAAPLDATMAKIRL